MQNAMMDGVELADLIQEGSNGLCIAVDRIIWPTIIEAEDTEQILKSLLSNNGIYL